MRRLADLTWTEAQVARAQRPLVLLPIGSTEAHGPHLPLATDVILSEELVQRAATPLALAGWTVLAAPSIHYSVTDYASEFAGTISIKPATARALLVDVCASLIEQGFRRVCFVNSHLEPAHAVSLREAVAEVEKRTGERVAFPDQLEKRWARTLSDEYKRGACHAGSYETSLLLAARADLVRDERLRLEPRPIDLAAAMRAGQTRFKETGADQAYFGDPAAATVAEGDDLYALLVTMVVETVRETWQ